MVPQHPDCQSLQWSLWPMMRKGFRQRRENTSSRFQAFYNTLGHENWNLCCLNDEMAHQRDLSWDLHHWSPRGHFHPGETKEWKTRSALLHNYYMSEHVLFFFSIKNQSMKPFSEVIRIWGGAGGLKKSFFMMWEFKMWWTRREWRGPENSEVAARHQSYFCT